MISFVMVPMPPESAEVSENVQTAPALTQERLKEVLDYNPESGVFTWRVKIARWIKVGDEAGTVDRQGYRIIMIDRKLYRRARLAYLYMEGVFPPNCIDHHNRIKLDDSWKNLRLATSRQNSQNTSLYINNTSGFKGVVWQSQNENWMARIHSDGKRKHLGCFNTPEEASAAYVAYAKEHFGEFCGETHK